jgi:hypothetical protein
MSNLLAMPLAQMDVQTGTNEDWIEAIKYVVGVDTGPQLDLRGINFSMEVRRVASDHEVILQASTDDGKIAVAASPDYGFLLFFIPYQNMMAQLPGAYVADVVGTDDTHSRVVIRMDVTIIEGVTRMHEGPPTGMADHIIALLPSLPQEELERVERAVDAELVRI